MHWPRTTQGECLEVFVTDDLPVIDLSMGV